ncbi:MAG: type II secretion system protein [Patescibacteria group bacterium]
MAQHLNCSKKEGFSLIEALLLVAVVGIFCVLFAVSLNQVRKGGYDAQIKNDIANLSVSLGVCSRTQNGSYSGCDSQLANQFFAPTCSANDINGRSRYQLKSNNDSFVVWLKLCSQKKYFCADQSGFIGSINVQPSLNNNLLSCRPQVSP